MSALLQVLKPSLYVYLSLLTEYNIDPTVICQISVINFMICVGLAVKCTVLILLQSSEPLAKNRTTDVR